MKVIGETVLAISGLIVGSWVANKVTPVEAPVLAAYNMIMGYIVCVVLNYKKLKQ